MNELDQQIDDRESQLYELIAVCLEATHEQRDGTVNQLISDFPQFSEELLEFLRGHSQLEQLVAPLTSLGRVQTDTVSAAGLGSVNRSKTLPELPEYESIEIIARGGMGIVYKARHKSLKRIVAIKMIRSAEMATDADVRKFREEAQRVAQLDHPQIVPVYEIGSHEGRPYFTMRLMEGGSLATRLAGCGLPVRQAAEVISQIARAVHFAHQRGILHRDIKPGNILFDGEGHPQIGDFGLAEQIDRDISTMQSVAIVGTPMYMAPEQARRQGALTTGVDVYGLGAVLYELLTGRPPFRADTPLNTLLELVHRDPRRPRSLDSKIDIDLETICLRCLDKDVDRRYGSAEALADDLTRWLRNEPILARRSSFPRRAVKWAKRSPAVAAMTAFSVVAVAFCVAALVISNSLIVHETNEKSQALLDRTNALRERTNALEDLKSLRRREQRLSYFQSIALAERELVAGNVARAGQILGDCPTDLRSWEWDYLHRLCHAEVESHATPPEPVCLSSSPTNDRIYVAGGVLGKQGTISVFDSHITDVPRIIRKDNEAITAMALSSDGRQVASASGNIVKVCGSENGEVITQFSGHYGGVCCVAFSPGGQQVASAGADRIVRIWDALSGRESTALTGHDDTIWSVAFSSDSLLIATSGADRCIKLWNAKSGECLRTFAGHQGLVRSVAFNSDNRRLVSAGYDNTARVWDVATGKEFVALTGHTGFVTRAVFSSDNQRIVTASVDETLRVWDAESGERLLLLRGHSSAVWDVAWLQNGRQVASVGRDARLKIWEATPHGMPQALGEPVRWIQRLELSTDGTRLALVHNDRTLEVWSTTSDTKLCAVPGSFDERSEFAICGNGRLLAVSEWKSIKIWNTDDGRLVSTIPTEEYQGDMPAMDVQGRILAAFEPNKALHVWDTSRNEELCKIALPVKTIANLVVSDDGRLLTAAIQDETHKTIQCVIWKSGGQEVARFAANGPRLTFTSDGSSLASFGNSSAVSVWNPNTGTLMFSVDRHRSAVRAVAFALEGDRLFTADDEGVITIWDIQTGHEVLALRELPVPVKFLAFPDRHALLGISRTGTARRWFAGSHSSTREGTE